MVNFLCKTHVDAGKDDEGEEVDGAEEHHESVPLHLQEVEPSRVNPAQAGPLVEDVDVAILVDDPR